MPNSVETELSCLNWNSSVSIQTFPIPFAVSLSISIYLSIYLYLYLSIYLSIYIYIYRERERTLFSKFPIRSLLKYNQLVYGPVVLLTLQLDLNCITNCSECTLPQDHFSSSSWDTDNAPSPFYSQPASSVIKKLISPV